MNTNQHDLSDDELDHIFRNAAENMAVDFETDSWTKMNQKLDDANLSISSKTQVEKTWFKRGLLLSVALLFLIGTYYFIAPSSDQPKVLQTKQKNTSAKVNEIDNKKYVLTHKVDTDNFTDTKKAISEQKTIAKNTVNSSESSSYEKNSVENKNSIIVESEKKDKISTNEEDIIKSKTRKINPAKNENLSKLLREKSKPSRLIVIVVDKPNETATINLLPKTRLIAPENIVSDKTGKKVNTTQSSENSEIDNTKLFTNIDSPNQRAINQPIEYIPQTNLNSNTTNPIAIDRLELGELKIISIKNIVFKTKLHLPIIAFENPKIEPVIPTNIKSISFQKGLYLRLAISPDFSVIPSNNFVKVGNNEAALVEYRFNEYWSLQTGVIRSLKRYIATPEQYAWNSNWNKPTPLIFVDATCKMLDIPFNIRYDFTRKSNSRWFVNSGFTSYTMLKEDYRYNYEDNTNPNIKYRQWTTKTGNYLFSVLNFSLGYERQILRKLSFQVEPFVKVPLKEVGFGKVKLATIGVFFSVKYPIKRF